MIVLGVRVCRPTASQLVTHYSQPKVLKTAKVETLSCPDVCERS